RAQSEIVRCSQRLLDRLPRPRRIPPRSLLLPPPSQHARRQTKSPPVAAESVPRTLLPCRRKSNRCHMSLHCSNGRSVFVALPSAPLLPLLPKHPPPRSRRPPFPQSIRLRAPAFASSQSSVSPHSYAQSLPALRAAPRAASAQSLRTSPCPSAYGPP